MNHAGEAEPTTTSCPDPSAMRAPSHAHVAGGKKTRRGRAWAIFLCRPCVRNTPTSAVDRRISPLHTVALIRCARRFARALVLIQVSSSQGCSYFRATDPWVFFCFFLILFSLPSSPVDSHSQAGGPLPCLSGPRSVFTFCSPGIGRSGKGLGVHRRWTFDMVEGRDPVASAQAGPSPDRKVRWTGRSVSVHGTMSTCDVRDMVPIA